MHNPISARPIALLVLVVLLGCQPDSKSKGPRLQDALPFLPLPPDPVFLSRTGGDSALQVVLTTPLSLDSTIDMYRRLLAKEWTLTGDQPAANGGRTLLAMRSGQPLWVMIIPNPAGSGTQVSLNGAVVARKVDATVKPPADSGAKPVPTRKPKPRD